MAPLGAGVTGGFAMRGLSWAVLWARVPRWRCWQRGRAGGRLGSRRALGWVGWRSRAQGRGQRRAQEPGCPSLSFLHPGDKELPGPRQKLLWGEDEPCSSPGGGEEPGGSCPSQVFPGREWLDVG